MQKTILIIGGGASGLYLRCFLQDLGYETVLIEKNELGHGQTIASQGILHRGLKYSLSSSTFNLCSSLDKSFEVWSKHFIGQGCLDLRQLDFHSKTMYFWTTNHSKIDLYNLMKAKIASCSLKSNVIKVPHEKYPSVFNERDNVNLYQIDEPSIDLRSFLTVCRNTDGGVIEKIKDRSVLELCQQYNPSVVIFSAGVGNEELIEDIGISHVDICQRRPLNMLIIKNMPHQFFGHCLQSFSDKPTFTITSQKTGEYYTWYVGGQIAEHANISSPQNHIANIKKIIEKNLPAISININNCQLFHVDRAERFCDGKRPDEPSIFRISKKIGDAEIYAVWPTKLVLIPFLAQKLVEALGLEQQSNCISKHDNSKFQIANYPWQE